MDPASATNTMEDLAMLRANAMAMRREPVSKRKVRLKKLRSWIHLNRQAIRNALYEDFLKPSAESDAIEILQVLVEIKHALANIDRWTAPHDVSATITLLGTTSHIQYEPRGLCLIISPWNYPFLLSVGPLVCALAAGNAVVIKPSELTPKVSAVIARMTKEIFHPSEVLCLQGGVDVAESLLNYPFDHIFFTGSPAVGKIVMAAAAKNLTSVTLELGGKSPAIVTRDADLKMAAERIAVAKFVNNGQTCIAPDYILVDKTVSDHFTNLIIRSTKFLFTERGEPFSSSKHYCRIVNEKHFDRIQDLVDDALSHGAQVVFGGESDRASCFIHPTILRSVSANASLMEEEIFGPVLPIVAYDNLSQAITLVNGKAKPLALYLFTNDQAIEREIIQATSSGGMCINDCGIHFFHHNLPFGGVNESGLGKSHGFFGFQAFSNAKGVLKQRKGWTSVKAFYPPYTATKERIMNWLLKLF